MYLPIKHIFFLNLNANRFFLFNSLLRNKINWKINIVGTVKLEKRNHFNFDCMFFKCLLFIYSIMLYIFLCLTE